MDRGPSLTPQEKQEINPYDFLGRAFLLIRGGEPYRLLSEGLKEPVAKKTMPLLDMGGMENGS